MIVYLNGHFVPQEEANISPGDRGFLFGDGAYEVIRSYEGNLFMAEKHLDRFARSLGQLQINSPHKDDLMRVTEKLIQKNDLESGEALVYLQITRGSAVRKHAFPDASVQPTVFARAWSYKPAVEKSEKGVKVILTSDIRWARCDIKSLNLLPNVLTKQQANENGAEEAIFVRDGAITEGSSTNLAAVINGVLFTHPPSHYILSGITRGVVLDLCQKLNIPVREYPIREGELKSADELMIMNTTSEVIPVIKVDDWVVGNGSPGPVTVKLLHAFKDLASGRLVL